jgi:hypothetical protein
LEDDNEEKLVEGMCNDNENGSTCWAVGSDSTTLSLIFTKLRPNGHPICISSFWEKIVVKTNMLIIWFSMIWLNYKRKMQYNY